MASAEHNGGPDSESPATAMHASARGHNENREDTAGMGAGTGDKAGGDAENRQALVKWRTDKGEDKSKMSKWVWLWAPRYIALIISEQFLVSTLRAMSLFIDPTSALALRALEFALDTIIAGFTDFVVLCPPLATVIASCKFLYCAQQAQLNLASMQVRLPPGVRPVTVKEFILYCMNQFWAGVRVGGVGGQAHQHTSSSSSARPPWGAGTVERNCEATGDDTEQDQHTVHQL